MWSHDKNRSRWHPQCLWNQNLRAKTCMANEYKRGYWFQDSRLVVIIHPCWYMVYFHQYPFHSVLYPATPRPDKEFGYRQIANLSLDSSSDYNSGIPSPHPISPEPSIDNDDGKTNKLTSTSWQMTITTTTITTTKQTTQTMLTRMITSGK